MTEGKISKWNNDSILSKIIVKSLFEDHEGSLWIGTNTYGLFRLKDGKFNSISVIDGLSENNVTCIFEDSSGGIWIGTDGHGLNYIKSASDGLIRILTSAQGLNSNFIYSITEDFKGEIWVGTSIGINILERSTQKVKSVINTNNGLPNEIINVLYRGNSGSVWVGTSGGGVVHFSDGKSETYSTKNGLSNNFVHSIYEDMEGHIWIGTYGGGVDRLANGKFTNYNSDSGLSNDFVFSVTGDKNGNIWLGTGGGLNRIHKGKIILISDKAPVFTDTIYNIFVSKNETLLLTSNIGLFLINGSDMGKYLKGDLDTLPYQLLNSKDGLNSDECSGGIQPAGYKSITGKIYIPTTKGVSIFDPSKKSNDQSPPPVYVESIKGDFPYTMKNGIAVFPGKTKKIDFIVYFKNLSILKLQLY